MLESIIIGLGTGLVSGWLSGWLVTKYYRNKDEKREKTEQKNRATALIVSYMEDIMTEIELLEKNQNADYGHLFRMLKKKDVRFEELPIIFAGEDAEEFHAIRRKLVLLETKINSEKVNLKEIKDIVIEINMLLLKNQFQQISK